MGTAETDGAGDPVGAADGLPVGAEVGAGGGSIVPISITFDGLIRESRRSALLHGHIFANGRVVRDREAVRDRAVRAIVWQCFLGLPTCAFFSSRARFDDEGCPDDFGSKLYQT